MHCDFRRHSAQYQFQTFYSSLFEFPLEHQALSKEPKGKHKAHCCNGLLSCEYMLAQDLMGRKILSILNIFSRNWAGLVLESVELIVTKDINVAQPIWLSGCPTKDLKQEKKQKKIFFWLFWALYRTALRPYQLSQLHYCPLHLLILPTQGPIMLNWVKNIENWQLKFFSKSAIWILFFKKKLLNPMRLHEFVWVQDYQIFCLSDGHVLIKNWHFVYISSREILGVI